MITAPSYHFQPLARSCDVTLCKVTRDGFHTTNKRCGVSVDECAAATSTVLIAKDHHMANAT
jgi:hypothetical protein